MNNISAYTYGKYIKTEKVGFNQDLKFNQGQTLQGRVIKQDSDSNKVTIKLTNGMEIEAELEGDLNLKDGLLKFEIADFKDNKLFLKLTSESTGISKGEGIKTGQDEIMNFILREGLKKEDYNILKQMVKHNIPLTRENITAVKSMIEFTDKMNNNPREIQNFINSYLNSRGVELNTAEGAMAANKLYEFFDAFSKGTTENILLFLENEIEFSKDNLDSYNKLFNSGNNIDKVVENINNKIVDAIAVEEQHVDMDSDISVHKEFSKEEVVNSNTLSKSISSTIINDSELNKSNTDVYKVSNALEGIVDNKNEVVVNNEKVMDIINTIKAEGKGELSKESIKDAFIKHMDIEVALSDKEVKQINEIINKSSFKESDLTVIKDIITKTIINKEEVGNKSIDNSSLQDKVFDISKSLSENVEKKSEATKDFIRNIISNLKESGNSSEIVNIMKNSINDLKLYNKISDQYYCLDVPVKANDNEYPCKLIIKDDRKEGKNIDSSNFKIAVSVKTIKLGTVDALLNVKDKNLDVELKCEKKLIEIFEISKSKLKEIIESAGFAVSIKVTEREEELELSSCREFFNDNNIAALDITV